MQRVARRRSPSSVQGRRSSGSTRRRSHPLRVDDPVWPGWAVGRPRRRYAQPPQQRARAPDRRTEVTDGGGRYPSRIVARYVPFRRLVWYLRSRSCIGSVLMTILPLDSVGLLELPPSKLHHPLPRRINSRICEPLDSRTENTAVPTAVADARPSHPQADPRPGRMASRRLGTDRIRHDVL